MYGHEYKVNVVADKALLLAYAEGEYEARRRHVRLAARDTPAARRPRFWWWRAALPALSTVVLGTWWWLL